MSVTVIENFPDINFIDDATVDEVLSQMINDYQDKYEELTGTSVSLARADPYRLIMYACAMQIYQAMQYADYAGKMSFLKYARGDYLDNLAALRGISRVELTAAVTTLKFSIESPIESVVAIPAGTKVTNGNDVFFATDEYAEIAQGETSVTVAATCTQAGSAGNGFEAGTFSTLVNTLPYISEVTNTDKTSGGADEESDDSLRERVYLVPGSYSVAGPRDAYVYWAKSVSSKISDVAVFSPEPCKVSVYPILENGELPEESLLTQVASVLNDDEIRPLTDTVTVLEPETKEYTISLKYYIASSDQLSVKTIQASIDTAVSVYKAWQCEKIGRDINPSYLIHEIMEAGAKRVEVASPVYTQVKANEIAACTSVTVSYGGLEDD